MKMNASILALALSLASTALPVHASTSFGGTRMLTQLDSNHTKSTKGVLTLDQTEHSLTFSDKAQSTMIPYAQITSMRLETTVTRLRQPFTGRVEQQQFLSVQYANPEGKHNYAVFQLKSNSYRETVAALEANTGKTVEQVSK